MVAAAEVSSVAGAPMATTRGPPRAVPPGAARTVSAPRAARTWDSRWGGLSVWNRV